MKSIQAEIPLNDDQKTAIGQIIQKLNRNGAFITASVIGNILRVSGTKADIEKIRSNLKSIYKML
jgi:hypothetical protein